MSLTDIKRSFTSVFEERLSSPFYGSLLISWVLWNWQIVYLTFFVSQTSIAPLNKIQYIQKYYNSPLFLFVLPPVSAFLIVVVLPRMTNWFYERALLHDKKKTEIKQKHDSASFMSNEQAGRLRNDTDRKVKLVREELEDKVADLLVVSQQLQLVKEERDIYLQELNVMKALRDQFRIISAFYGKGGTYVDVTSVVENNLNSLERIVVTNDILGQDPVRFVQKELIVTYNNRGVKFLKAFEYEIIIKKKDNTLVIEETEDSLVHRIRHNHRHLAELFPGTWSSTFIGHIEGTEEFQIRPGGEYWVKVDGVFKHVFDLHNILIDESSKTIKFEKRGLGKDKRTTTVEVSIEEKYGLYKGFEDDGKMTLEMRRLTNAESEY